MLSLLLGMLDVRDFQDIQVDITQTLTPVKQFDSQAESSEEIDPNYHYHKWSHLELLLFLDCMIVYVEIFLNLQSKFNKSAGYKSTYKYELNLYTY